MKKLLLIMLASFSTAAQTAEWEADNHTKVIFVEVKEMPIVDVAIAFHAGSRYAQPGLANLTGQATMLGSKFFSKEQVSAKINITGSEIKNYVDEELIVYHLRSLSNVSQETMVDQLNSAVFNAAFPGQELRFQRQNILSDIAYEQTQPEEIAKKHLFKSLFPSASRYNSPVKGYPDTIDNYHTSDLQKHHAKTLGQPFTTIIIVGNTSIDNAKTMSEALSKKLIASNSTFTKEKLYTANDPQTISIKPEQKQSYFLLATKIPVASTEKPFVTHLLLNEILGGNSSSYLFQSFRDNKGLVNSITSTFESVDDFSLLSITGQSQTKDNAKIDGLLSKAFKNKTDIITEKRFNIAKKSLKNKLLMNTSSNQKKLERLIVNAKNNHPKDYDEWLIKALGSVTIKDVAEALDHINGNQFYKVYVGC
ncbi:MAG: pitrilysin family protein [Gammaproteobacteria bacterium]|nr:pitrilysin family protein [Gammaproteobacteria bacterium]